jgi:hypothetical protein
LLVIAAILIGEGSPVKKAVHLFEEYDADCNDSIPTIQLNTMFDDITTVAMLCLESAKVETLNSGNVCLADYTTALQEKMATAKAKFTQHLIQSYLENDTTPETLPKSEFVETMAAMTDALNPSWVRTYISSI